MSLTGPYDSSDGLLLDLTFNAHLFRSEVGLYPVKPDVSSKRQPSG
jgi:hypothetical protein